MALVDKNAIKADIRQSLMEKIMATNQPDEPQYSVGGFFSNVKSDVGEIVRGIGALMGMGGKAIMHPIETIEFVKSPAFKESLKMVGSSLKSEYGEYKQPLKKLYEDPLQVVTDAMTIATLGGAAFTKVGMAGGVSKALTEAGIASKSVPALARAGDLGKTAQIGATLSYLGNPLKLSKDLAKFGISKIPGGKEFLTALEQRSKTIDIVGKTQQSHLIERNKLLGQVDETIKNLTPEEQATLIPYAEGTIELTITPSENFTKAVGLVKQLATQREETIGKAGLLKPELIEQRKWQPILKQLFGDETTPKIAPQAQKATQKAITAEKGIIPQELQPLVTFSDKEITQYKNVATKLGEAPRTMGDGIYFFSKGADISTGSRFGKIKNEAYLKPEAKIIDAGNKNITTNGKINNDVFQEVVNKIREVAKVEGKDTGLYRRFIDRNVGREHLPAMVKELGYDGIKIGDQTVVYNADKILTKSQLTQAVKEVSKTGEEIKIPLTIPEQIAEAKKLLGFSKDPIYVQHIFDDKPKKFADFFVNTAPVKNWKPGFLKKSFGVPGYSIDSKMVLKWQTAQTLKFKNNIDLLEKIKGLDFVEPLDDLKNLKPGYKVFAPDGFIRFYKGTLDLVDEFTKKINSNPQMNAISDVWDNLKEAIDSSMIEKTYMGITTKGVKLYQVPNSVAGVLQGYAKSTAPWIKLFIDKPVDAFRFMALALTPRWLVNNIIGNTLMSIIAGDPLSPAGYLVAKKAQELGLVPDDVFSGFYRTEKLMSGQLGKAAETKLGQIMSGVGQKIVEAPIIKQIGKIGDFSYKINSITDDWFRSSHYVNVATKEAKLKIFQTTGQKLNNTIKLLEYAKQDPEILEKAIASVNDFFYSASKLSPFERNVVRRFLPFYSWYKFISLYSVRLPFEHPGRFNIISNLARTFYQITGQDQLPNYLKGSVPIGEAENGDIYYLRTSGVNPFGLLEDLATIGWEQTMMYSMTPPIKTMIERFTARESFSGKGYTAKDVIENYGGALYRFNPETGKAEEVEGKPKPVLLEHLLRNFVPQYQLLEQAITGGAQTYTSAGLPSLISGEGIKKSPITGEPIVKPGAKDKALLRVLGTLGIPISSLTSNQQQVNQEAVQKATTQFFYQQNPMMSPQYKTKLKDDLKQQILEKIESKGILEGLF